jgi:hypothetical protein
VKYRASNLGFKTPPITDFTLAAELVTLKTANIIAGAPPAALAVRDVTHTIPIVMNSLHKLESSALDH